MIFQAANINHLSTRIDLLTNVFTEGFDLAFDMSQIELTGTMFFHEFYEAWDGWHIVLRTKNPDDEPVYVSEKRFPLYFELIEDDFCKEQRQARYQTPFEKFRGQILSMESPFIQTRKA